MNDLPEAAVSGRRLRHQPRRAQTNRYRRHRRGNARCGRGCHQRALPPLRDRYVAGYLRVGVGGFLRLGRGYRPDSCRIILERAAPLVSPAGPSNSAPAVISGPGIDQESKQRLLDSFFGHNSTQKVRPLLRLDPSKETLVLWRQRTLTLNAAPLATFSGGLGSLLWSTRLGQGKGGDWPSLRRGNPSRSPYFQTPCG
jgi:hypothetical protein